MLHMLQWLHTYVSSVGSKCFICFRRILQVFYLVVVKVDLDWMLHIYAIVSNVFIHMLRVILSETTYVVFKLFLVFCKYLQTYVCKCFNCFGRTL
jgi:hypothetical protein